MQTTIQQTSAIRKGSVKILVGDDVNSLVDIGAIRDPKLVSMAEQQNIEFDNVASLKQFAEGDKVHFDFTLCEINWTNMAKMDSGMITVTPVASSPVAVTGEAHGTGWTQGKPIKLTNKNGDNTVATSITVKAGGSSLVANTDYRTYVGDGTNGELGATYIVPITSQTLAITVDYTYTPNASKKVTFTNSGTKVLKYVRVINTDSNSKVFQIDIQKVTNVKAPEIDFPADDEANVAVMPLSLEGYIKEIVDEQQTA